MPDGPTGVVAGVCVLAVVVGVDLALDRESAALVGTYVTAPFVVALIGGPRATAAVGLLAMAAAAASPLWNMNVATAEQAARLGVIGFGSVLAVIGSWIQERSRGRSERLRLLDAVGDVADGSLPLAETLQRVVGEIVPAIGDICMLDAIYDGRVKRIATRVGGSDRDAEIERSFHQREPTLPSWLVSGERHWRHIPRWVARLSDEELKRMSHSPEDLAFLRSLDVRSSIVAPIRARDRNLGSLTLLTAWSGREYSADDVRFVQILASRIGLALDNAGLFSDLESVERRMDTVMSILDEAVVIHDADGALIFANPAAARTLGYETSEQALAATGSELGRRLTIRDEQGRMLGPDALAGRRVLGGDPGGAQTLRVTDRGSGRERWYRTKARAITGTDGEALYSVTAIEDVTEVKRAEFSNRLLARTGELLSHAVDYRRTLERIPHLLVPDFTDWCSVELPGADGVIERVAMAHADPPRGERMASVRERFRARMGEDTPIGRALRTGEAQRLTVEASDLSRVARNQEHLNELLSMEVASVIVAPMTAGGDTVGALTFVNHIGSRLFDDDDLIVGVEVARRAGLAIENARIADERARVADALQRELLPPTLPRMRGWEVATMYEPAGEINEVGGDFYEVFPVAGGWAVALGDVSGKGAAAAALTAEARHTIRTAGELSEDPCTGLYVLNRNLCARDDAALCSVALLVLPEPGSQRKNVGVYLAGHPHPIALRAEGTQEVGKPGPLLGVSPDPSWPRVAVELDPGDQLVLFTDGVIEAKRAGGERFGTERLLAGLAGADGPQGVVERVRQALAGFGAGTRDDDAAVVAIARAGAQARGVPPSAEGRTDASTSEASRAPSLG